MAMVRMMKITLTTLVFLLVAFFATSQESWESSNFTSALPNMTLTAFRRGPVRRLTGYNYAHVKKVMNEIDACWRNDVRWASRRQSLANCAVGFGALALGGKYGRIYTVTDAGDNPSSPEYGTLRWGVIQKAPLWIIFAEDMTIRLQAELMVNSYKTIDGRGASVHIAYGPCITVQHVSHVIIHGLHIHDCKAGYGGTVRDSPTHVGRRGGSDGDAIAVFDSNNVWIDHCALWSCADGLIDVIHESTYVTVSNCHFFNHDKVMLLGHDDSFLADKILKVTIVYNRFGPNLVQRMPRGRFGYFHLANNDYIAWEMYAIGGSANPTIRSEGNRFIASNDHATKQVTKREGKKEGHNSWNWRSVNDVFVNGAYFVQSGYGTTSPRYTPRQRFTVRPGSYVSRLTADVGPLSCRAGKSCRW